MRHARLVLLFGLAACAIPAATADPSVIVAPPVRSLSFADIGTWDYVHGLDGMPANVKALSGQRVQMTGILIPIDAVEGCDFILGEDREWLFHDGPGVHETVHVVLPQPVQLASFPDAVTVVGTFVVKSVVIEGYCVEIFRLDVESLEPTKRL